MDYIEFHARSAFSFLRGSSLPEHLVQQARAQELSTLALCDRGGLYGIPRFVQAAKEQGLRPIVGCELPMADRSILPVLVENPNGYRNLCQLLSRVHLRAPKGEGVIEWKELPQFAEGLIALSGDHEGPLQASGKPFAETLEALQAIFPNRLYVEIQRHLLRGENRGVQALVAGARQLRLPLLATNGISYAQARGREVLDVFTCLRQHTHLDLAGRHLSVNSERHLKTPQQMGALFADLPEAILNTQRLAERINFSLSTLGYEFPVYECSGSQSEFLRQATLEGAHRRYGATIPRPVLRQLRHELELINRLGFAGYFLIVWDLVNFCREQAILVQGRGSAANSAVCYCLGITAVDAVASNLLFERFLSEGRKSWPDIDLDLPSGSRREQVIQEVYRRYGREGAAMTANVITYRGRSAAREIGKALNLPPSFTDRFSALFASGDYPHTLPVDEQLRSAGIPPEHPRTPVFLSLYQAIHGLPRHLGQHSGGMIICKNQLSSIVPLENASMAGRSVAQWDKEDCANLGIIKVDLLGLGMMSVLQDTVHLCAERQRPVDLATIPKDDSATFDLICAADTIGVFQIESRAQMATLPRMQPRCFYDVCIEVAIIRPGPIQGDLLHPYLARRCGEAPETYDDPRLIPVLKRTLGVPLFQEQLLKIAMVMGDFNGSEAEDLRRALSFQRSPERMAKVTAKLRQRMTEKGLASEVIERIAKSIGSFALYGFPESHAISFAILSYASAWLKVHRAPEFFTGLLNNQPMGFYSPATLIKDAQRHGLRIRAACIARSDWNSILEADDGIRLGLRMIRGLNQDHAQQLLAARQQQPFTSLEELKARVHLDKDEWRVLAEIGALNCLASHRRDALWQVEHNALPADDLFARCAESPPAPTPLPAMQAGERLAADYLGIGLTTGPHPMALIRSEFPDLWRACDLPQVRHGQRIRSAGNVICRQRPGTAKGFVFLSLEDETGIINVIIPPALFESLRLRIVHEPFLLIEGVAQNQRGVIHLRAEQIEALQSQPIPATSSYDFH